METRVLLILAQPCDAASLARILRRAITVLSTLEKQDSSIGLLWNTDRLQYDCSGTVRLERNAPTKDWSFRIVYETVSELVAIGGENGTILTILINPCLRTLRRTLYENLLSMNDQIMFKCHVLYAGYTHKRSDWILDDCTLSAESLHSMVDALKRTIVAENKQQKPLSFGTSPFRMKRSVQNQTTSTNASLNVRYTAVREQQPNSPRIENSNLVLQLSRLLSRAQDNPVKLKPKGQPHMPVLSHPSAAFEKPFALICAVGDGDGFLFRVGGYCVAVNGGFPLRGSFGDLLRRQKVDSLILTHLGFDTIGSLRSLATEIAANRVVCRNIFANWPVDADRSASCAANSAALGPAPRVPTPSSPSRTNGLITGSPSRSRSKVGQSLTSTASAKRGESMNVDELREFDFFMNSLLSANLRVRPYLAVDTRRLKFSVLFRRSGHGVLLACALSPRPDATEWIKFVHMVNRERHTRDMRVGLHEFPLAHLVSMAVLLVFAEEHSLKLHTVLYPGNLPTRHLLKAIDRLSRVDLSQVARAALSGGAPNVVNVNVSLTGHESIIEPEYSASASASMSTSMTSASPKSTSPRVASPKRQPDHTARRAQLQPQNGSINKPTSATKNVTKIEDHDQDQDQDSRQDFLLYRSILSVGGIVTVLTPITECGEDTDLGFTRKALRDAHLTDDRSTGIVQLITESPLHSSSFHLVQEIIEVSSTDSDLDDDDYD